MASQAWIGHEPFDVAFYFNKVPGKTMDLELAIEGTEPIWIDGAHLAAAADAMYHEFERGAVLANPSEHPFTFDLAKLLPGRKYRRLRGSPDQDPAVNNGQPIAEPITLGAKDGLFLVRE